MDPNEHDVFHLRQRVRMMVNQYEFSLPGGGRPFMFVQQKRMKLKEDIRFFADDTKQQELMRIQARQRFDPRARYDVTTAEGEKVGEIQKVFGASLLRSTYRLYDAAGQEVGMARERNMAVALIRRIVQFIPFVESVADWLPIPYHFDFMRGEERLGTNTRQMWKIRDVYTIDMTPDADRTLDRRLVLALAVGMDALQAR